MNLKKSFKNGFNKLFFYIVIKRIILAVILAADGSHLINETIILRV